MFFVMSLPQPPLRSQASKRLDLLLAQSIKLAIEQRLPEVSEAILCALEAHAKTTADTTQVDAAYLRATRAIRRGDR
ncbi:hypothetical protein LPB72_09960 [Hydrogenophaga crassostreae]|uniref:CopG family transcriptional regulator n=1 Tax=Hydrogenophaga crassostreae TaxID=1763535 RepID=A0A162SY86_9BURK|nr:hypothetical protein LPB072_11340 [Hydrogenophaga crassostreae]OAD41641.1 hypothetical protein LPB72_09960 [Hydrogenophaga crassostreae]